MNAKRRKIIDKLIMGAIIGGAIGSVVGYSIKSQKDENEHREKSGLEKTGKEKAKNLTLKVLKKAVGVFSKRKKDDVKKIPTETEN